MCLAVACVGDKEGDGLAASAGPVTSATTGDVEGDTDGETMTPVMPTSGGTGDATTSRPDPDTTGDPPPDGTTGEPEAAACGKVDLLFVIDSSSTMAAEQQALIAAFPAFHDALSASLGAVDWHIMAVSADDGQTLGLDAKCKMGECTCTSTPTCCANVCQGGLGMTCNTFACADLPFSECTFKFGTGREFGADGGPCGLSSGQRYITADQPDVPAAFACTAAGVGAYDTFGDKRPMLAAVEATSLAQNTAGSCNSGFLRDDALLVVVVVSDKDDDNQQGATGSPGSPQEWHDALLTAKGGNTGGLVVLGLLGDGNLEGGTCTLTGLPNPDGLGAAPAPRLQEFVGLFANGAVGSVCAADYAPFLTESVALIGQACESFAP